MPVALSLLLLLGVFTEERVPAEGYACLNVVYRRVIYKAVKFERTRLTGTVTLTLPNTADTFAELLGRKVERRTIQLSGYELVVDSNDCTCMPAYAGGFSCLDR